jgi:hypothetical protein
MTGNYATPVSQPRRHRRFQLVVVSRMGGVVEGQGQSLLGCSQSRNLGVAYPEAPRRVSAEYGQHADGAHVSEVIRRGNPRRMLGGRIDDIDDPLSATIALATQRPTTCPHNARLTQPQEPKLRQKNSKFCFYYRAFWGCVYKSMKIDGTL